MPRGAPVLERIFARADRGGECWVWTLAVDRDGYGKVQVKGRTLRPHRVVYETLVGPIPEGLVVCHRCDNPRCVRPDHLFLGTQAENIADRDAKGHTARGLRSGPHTRPDRRCRGDAWRAARGLPPKERAA